MSLPKLVFRLNEEGEYDGYKLLSGLVVPRPIGWIGTVRQNGTYNLAPFSFFNLVAVDPPTVIFSGGRHLDRPKDSVVLAEEAGEFTVNIVSEDVVEAMNNTSVGYDADVDEFEVVGLTSATGLTVRAPLVVESPANLECRVTRVVDIGGANRVVFGEVLVVHVRPDVLDGTRVNTDVLRAVGRLAGPSFVRTVPKFDLERP
ncbi:MAG: flavin reductase family protein [Actinobacteria bacterium]|nr:flavin reductase family protein [Actinomycetota bacterium]MCI0544891.1 flavin reductase family protein [Actinomycetota bacterium]MCI0678482.1 flavin reductase family protein [Actinomycetota bacterium]